MTSSPPVADLSDVIAEFNRQIARCKRRWGSESHAVLMVKLEFLLSVLTLRSADTESHNQLRGLTEELREDIRCRFLRQGVRDDDYTWATVVDDRLPLIEFDRESFDKHYALRATAIKGRIIRPSVDNTELLPRRASLMYVVDHTGELILYNVAFSLRELVLGRNIRDSGAAPVTHPMMVPDTLQVRSAGELILVGAESVAFVVANTRSGHFRPPPVSQKATQAACTRAFGLPPESVFTFALFGEDRQ